MDPGSSFLVFTELDYIANFNVVITNGLRNNVVYGAPSNPVWTSSAPIQAFTIDTRDFPGKVQQASEVVTEPHYSGINRDLITSHMHAASATHLLAASAIRYCSHHFSPASSISHKMFYIYEHSAEVCSIAIT